MDAKIIEQVREQHPDADLHELSARGHSVIVRVPSRSEWRRFKAQVADERKKLDAAEFLLRTCCVYPDAPALDALLERLPALADLFGGELAELAGADKDVEKKRL